eukprot:CAMPEP_0197020774 /NCGR_PEP_ID=MMETSP1384-20130603/1667_1 /TAXON_ID=29189 /ORGANISM="Ammonia sp." /LENGTH=498 /DNA_ID=CAMNT_0042448463 /DNA_START=70 /DNA_END=1566 /DNA_ORIENTATION=+
MSASVNRFLINWLKDNNNKRYLSELSSPSASSSSGDSPKDSDHNNSEIDVIPHRAKRRKLDREHSSNEHAHIKPFHLNARPSHLIEQELRDITHKFTEIVSSYHLKASDGLTLPQFEAVTIEIAGFSRYCNKLLFQKILAHAASQHGGGSAHRTNAHQNERAADTEAAAETEAVVTLPMLIAFWKQYFIQNDDVSFRFIETLKHDENGHYLLRSDFTALLKQILYNHDGLRFLKDSEVEFHAAYIETVICRIFYQIDTDEDGKIHLSELKKSNFMQILYSLDTETNINEIFDYFSYEHFYVIYHKFWELDEDHDELLTAKDLLKYADYSLTPIVCERIVKGYGYKTMAGGARRAMKYCDFVHFIISEEDKTSSKSINYWFRILDVDADGILTPYELEMFFDQQSTKIHKLCGETFDFQDILVRLNDMIAPKVNFHFTLKDIKKSRMGHVFIDTLVNISKFAQHQENDIEAMNEIRSTPHLTDWDRFAAQQYSTLTYAV